MPLSQSSRCQHTYNGNSIVCVVRVKPFQKYIARCAACGLTGDEATTQTKASINFWGLHAINQLKDEQEKIMAYAPTEDYQRGFRYGVTLATEQLYSGYDPATVPIRDINKKLLERRKNLLTKKVTKWINIWETGPSVSDPASVRFGTGVLYDDKATAEANVIDPSRRDFLGTYPIELETEI